MSGIGVSVRSMTTANDQTAGPTHEDDGEGRGGDRGGGGDRGEGGGGDRGEGGGGGGGLGEAQFGPHRFYAGEGGGSEEFRGARFDVADMRGARFTDCDLSGVTIRDGWLVDVSISGYVSNVTVNDIDVTDFVNAELDRRHPERKQLREIRTAEGFRAMWDTVERLWAKATERAGRLPAAALTEQVNQEWSFAQTLRHLVFITDAWASRTVLDQEMPYHPIGLPQSWYPAAEAAGLGLDLTAEPGYDDVLAARADRMAVLARIVAGLTDDDLGRRCRRSPAPGYPEEERIVAECVAVVIEEEIEHYRFAVRDLAVLESRASLAAHIVPVSLGRLGRRVGLGRLSADEVFPGAHQRGPPPVEVGGAVGGAGHPLVAVVVPGPDRDRAGQAQGADHRHRRQEETEQGRAVLAFEHADHAEHAVGREHPGGGQAERDLDGVRARHAERGEPGQGQPEAGRRQAHRLDRELALAAPVDVLQVQDQRELIQDQGGAGTDGHRGERAPAQGVRPADRREGADHQQDDAGDGMMNMGPAGRDLIPERAAAIADHTRDRPGGRERDDISQKTQHQWQLA
jgi:DinB superfamily/Pentapeptide repeats (8 copies)